MVEFICKSLDTLNTGCKPWNMRKKSHAIQNNDINNKEKTASSKLVSVKWCDIHKEWYIKA